MTAASGHGHDHGHDHEHGHGHGHGHGHDYRAASRRALGIAFFLLLGTFLAELVGGLLTGSLALLADAGHLLTDVAAVALALLAQHLARRPSSPRRSFGFRRGEILAALINGFTLWLIAAYILYEAVVRLGRPPEVHTGPMILIAFIGLLTQTAAAIVLSRAQGESLNVRGAYLHAFTDAIQSAAIVVVGILMWVTRLWILDPVVSLLIVGLLLWSGGHILWEATHVLMEGTPRELDLRAIVARLHAVPGVARVSDLHAWSLTTGYNALSAHVVVQEGVGAAQRDALSQELSRLLTTSFPVQHVTLQVEECCELCARGDCAGWLERPAAVGRGQ
jgi:cobalt-zinc-cadmium efflux system protein